MVAQWKEWTLPGNHVDFGSLDDVEDLFPIDKIGWDGASFCGPDDRPLTAAFKPYPWEWMVREEFAAHLGKHRTI